MMAALLRKSALCSSLRALALALSRGVTPPRCGTRVSNRGCLAGAAGRSFFNGSVFVAVEGNESPEYLMVQRYNKSLITRKEGRRIEGVVVCLGIQSLQGGWLVGSDLNHPRLKLSYLVGTDRLGAFDISQKIVIVPLELLVIPCLSTKVKNQLQGADDRYQNACNFSSKRSIIHKFADDCGASDNDGKVKNPVNSLQTPSSSRVVERISQYVEAKKFRADHCCYLSDLGGGGLTVGATGWRGPTELSGFLGCIGPSDFLIGTPDAGGFCDIEFVPFCRLQIGMIGPVERGISRPDRNHTSLAGISKATFGGSNLEWLLHMLRRAAVLPRVIRSFTSDFPAGLAVPNGKRSDSAYSTPHFLPVAASSSDRCVTASGRLGAAHCLSRGFTAQAVEAETTPVCAFYSRIGRVLRSIVTGLPVNTSLLDFGRGGHAAAPVLSGGV